MRLIYRVKQLILLGGDLMSYFVALFLSIMIRNAHLPTTKDLDLHLVLFSGMFCLWVVINYINGIYDLGTLGKKTYVKRFLETALMTLVVSITFFYILPSRSITPKTMLLLNVSIGYGISFVWRILYYKAINKQRRLHNTVLIVGFSNEAMELVHLLHDQQDKGYTIAAIVDPENKSVSAAPLPSSVTVYHQLHDLQTAITKHHIDQVVVAPHIRQKPEALRELYELLFLNVQMSDLTSFYEIITGRIPPSIFSEGWFLEHFKNKDQPIYTKVRACVDALAAIMMACAFIILLPFIALGIKLGSSGPIFISQQRVGHFGKLFTMYKFRSMYALSPDGSAETAGVEFAVKNDKRITTFGKFLRKTRLDELPQCWNLLLRQVTLIGPRPERPEIVSQLEANMPYYRLRHCIKPGITGWAAIHQHYTDTLETSLQKLQYDLFYIKNKSPLLDLSILLRTINIVVRMMGQ